jgi:hypothetical protein
MTTQTSAPVVELSPVLSELRTDTHSPTAGPSSSVSPDDIELMRVPSVVGREAGERDPLLLRSKIISDADLDGLRR